MDLKQIYTYIIDKGNLFGIVCVVVLIVISSLLASRTVTDTRFTSLLKFLSIFVIASLIFIIVLKLSSSIGLLTPTTQKTTSQDSNNVVDAKTEKDSSKKRLVSIPRIFTVNATTSVQFTADASLLVLQKIKEGGVTRADTLIDDELEKISKIKVDDEYKTLGIYHSGADGQPDEFALGENFDERPLHSYLDRLETAGYKIEYVHSQEGFFYVVKTIIFIAILLSVAIAILKFILGLFGFFDGY